MESYNDINIQFLGAAGTVTGSKHLLQLGPHKILIDCGLFQGEDEVVLNERPLPVAARDIDCVLLTHAHLDHTGYLPVLVRQGFKGKVYATSPTVQITEIILTDSAKIAEEEKTRILKKNKHRFQKLKNLVKAALPWQYSLKEVSNTIALFSPVRLDEWLFLFSDVRIRYHYNGHIIGACFIEIQFKDKTIVFSGDIGRQNDLLLYPPQQPERADILIIESTYGNRLHPGDAVEQLVAVVKQVAVNRGTLIIPSFAVERTQMLMYLLWQMQNKGSIPNLPIYMDSPMGKNVLEVFHHNSDWDMLPPDECASMCTALKLVKTIKETYEVIDNKNAKIVIAGSGMVTGGRVLTYLQYYIQEPATTILLAGFQAKGTNGRLLQEGVKTLNIRGKKYPVKASVKTIEGLSGHADQNELLWWMERINKKPEAIHIVHGEPEAANALSAKIKEVYGWSANIPEAVSNLNALS